MPNHALHKFLWQFLTLLGLRRMTRLLQRLVPAYRDTTFFFETSPATTGYVALTIDDGLSKKGMDTSMVTEVCDMLHKYQAHATFFVCSDYTTTDLARPLLERGHELANHMKEAIHTNYYRLSQENFERELRMVNDALDQIDGGVSLRWFRAPNALMNRGMRKVVNAHGMRHALGDVYCDDWAFAKPGTNDHVAPLMLRQVHTGGSIAVFHMPVRGYSEAFLKPIEAFVKGAAEKGLRCITLTQMTKLETS